MKFQTGFSLIEVLVTILILAFGLLGLAGLQARTMNLEMESYQRSQALVILNDMAARLENNAGANGVAYKTGVPLGTGQSVQVCPDAGAERDKCEWSNLLLGAGESLGGSNVGAMIGARGCIDEIQAPDPTSGNCKPGIYQVTVAWQGINPTAAPGAALTCASDLYGDEKLRRVVSLRIAAATTGCEL